MRAGGHLMSELSLAWESRHAAFDGRLYGLVSYSANRRTREIGIRMRGADPLRVAADPSPGLWLSLSRGARLFASRGMDAGCGGISSAEVTELAYTDRRSSLLLVTMLAALSRRRASLVNPTVALRHD